MEALQGRRRHTFLCNLRQRDHLFSQTEVLSSCKTKVSCAAFRGSNESSFRFRRVVVEKARFIRVYFLYLQGGTLCLRSPGEQKISAIQRIFLAIDALSTTQLLEKRGVVRLKIASVEGHILLLASCVCCCGPDGQQYIKAFRAVKYCAVKISKSEGLLVALVFSLVASSLSISVSRRVSEKRRTTFRNTKVSAKALLDGILYKPSRNRTPCFIRYKTVLEIDAVA